MNSDTKSNLNVLHTTITLLSIIVFIILEADVVESLLLSSLLRIVMNDPEIRVMLLLTFIILYTSNN